MENEGMSAQATMEGTSDHAGDRMMNYGMSVDATIEGKYGHTVDRMTGEAHSMQQRSPKPALIEAVEESE